jgi:hypothetical protein
MLLLVGEFFMLVFNENTALGSLVGLFGLSFLELWKFMGLRHLRPRNPAQS